MRSRALFRARASVQCARKEAGDPTDLAFICVKPWRMDERHLPIATA